MKNTLFIFSLILFVFYISNANAVIGSAGCGLGSVVFRGTQWWKQIFALTSNQATGSQAFGITSGTSGCPPAVFGVVENQEEYIEINLSSLQKEAAQGTGELLFGLAYRLGCDQMYFPDFGSYTQKNYIEIFSSQNAKNVLWNIKNLIQKNENLAHSCKYIHI
ncbi:DUF3015 family protein [Silvanigrella sp.]|uniref:DUF3015 family protein n=1 Tax=Silvanigrella sp. TaxID=2024976 RepID=UPI0037C6D349